MMDRMKNTLFVPTVSECAWEREPKAQSWWCSLGSATRRQKAADRLAKKASGSPDHREWATAKRGGAHAAMERALDRLHLEVLPRVAGSDWVCVYELTQAQATMLGRELLGIASQAMERAARDSVARQSGDGALEVLAALRWWLRTAGSGFCAAAWRGDARVMPVPRAEYLRVRAAHIGDRIALDQYQAAAARLGAMFGPITPAEAAAKTERIATAIRKKRERQRKNDRKRRQKAAKLWERGIIRVREAGHVGV